MKNVIFDIFNQIFFVSELPKVDFMLRNDDFLIFYDCIVTVLCNYELNNVKFTIFNTIVNFVNVKISNKILNFGLIYLALNELYA